MVNSDVGTPGLPEFLIINFIGKVIFIAFIDPFFLGGQEIRKIMVKIKLEPDETVIPYNDEIVSGTNSI